MALNETEIKTRQGLILELVLGAALKKGGFSFDHDVQYDSTCEKPDFLIPNETNPKFMVEVHQTEARNSFQMKTLRAFTAVTESKAHFGNALVSVNVLVGDPDNELPASNVKAMCGIFDVNIVPRRDASMPGLIQKLEAFSLSLAMKEGKNTEKAAEEVVKKHGPAVTELAKLVKSSITKATARAELDDLWNLERTRDKGIGDPPLAGDPTYYKRCMLWSLFLDDSDFAELHTKQDPDLCSDTVKRQLVATKLATVEEEVDGDYYTLKPVFTAFLKDPDCIRLRTFCKSILDTIPSMKWFFEDIRDGERRLKMARNIVNLVNKGNPALESGVESALANNVAFGIEHARCWIADGMAALACESQNSFNKRMVQSGRDPENYQYPYNNITGRFERMMGCPDHFRPYSKFACEVFYEFCSGKGIAVSPLENEASELADLLLSARLDGAVKLQRLSPLDLIVESEAAHLDLSCEKIKVKSLAFDLAGGKGRLGKYDTLEVADGKTKCMVVAVAIHDNHGDDKSKEWGARRLASLYRMEQGKIRKSEYQEGIFVIDGEWKDKDVARLHRSGWNHVVRLTDLETTLRSVFGIKKSAKKITMGAADVALPLAAEGDTPPELKRNGGNG